MKVTPTTIPEVLVIEPNVFGDDRGFFFESFNLKSFSNATGITADFVQDNHSKSLRNVIRGLHYQIQQPQGRLVRAIVGEIFDVAVDIRKSSPTFGKWVGEVLSAENKKQLWIPSGFAHGFLTLSESAEVLYKTSSYYSHEHDRCIAWNDSAIGIRWPTILAPIMSVRDSAGIALAHADLFD